MKKISSDMYIDKTKNTVHLTEIYVHEIPRKFSKKYLTRHADSIILLPHKGGIGMLNILIKEFIAVCDYLIKKNTRIHKGYILIGKDSVSELLDKNHYDTALNKLKYWKELGWIDAEEKRLTKRIYDGESGQYIPYVKINVSRYECMKKLSETGLNG